MAQPPYLDSSNTISQDFRTSPGLFWPCPGALITWGLGSPYVTYPFALHAPSSRLKPGYALLEICPQDSLIRTRSIHCSGSGTGQPSPSCGSCQGTAPLVKAVEDHARKLPTHLDRMLMSHEQLRRRLEAVEKKERKEALKVCTYLNFDFDFGTNSISTALECLKSTWSSSRTSRNVAETPPSGWYIRHLRTASYIQEFKAAELECRTPPRHDPESKRWVIPSQEL